MPTYEYECRSCRHRFETFQSMTEDALTDCPECNGSQLRRLIGGGSAIIFKGAGFYVNDSRKSDPDSKSASPTTDSSKASKTSTSTQSTGDTGTSKGTSGQASA